MFQTWKSYFFWKKNVSPLQSIAFHCVLSAQEIARQGRVLSRRWRPTDLKRYTRGKGPGQKWGGKDAPKIWEFCPLNLACESYQVVFFDMSPMELFGNQKPKQGGWILGLLAILFNSGRCMKSHRKLYFSTFFLSMLLVSRNSIFLYFSTVFVVYSDLDDAHSCSKFLPFQHIYSFLAGCGQHFCLPYVPRAVPKKLSQTSAGKNLFR